MIFALAQFGNFCIHLIYIPSIILSCAHVTNWIEHPFIRKKSVLHARTYINITKDVISCQPCPKYFVIVCISFAIRLLQPYQLQFVSLAHRTYINLPFDFRGKKDIHEKVKIVNCIVPCRNESALVTHNHFRFNVFFSCFMKNAWNLLVAVIKMDFMNEFMNQAISVVETKLRKNELKKNGYLQNSFRNIANVISVFSFYKC